MRTQKGTTKRGEGAQEEGEQLPCIAYFSTRTGVSIRHYSTDSLMLYTSDLFVTNLDGQRIVNVTGDPRLHLGSPSAWSPDGKYLSWSGRDGLELFANGQKDTLVTRIHFGRDGHLEPFANGQKDSPVTRTDYLISTYAWSPGSDHLAFIGNKRLGETRVSGYALYVMDLESRSTQKIMDWEGYDPGYLHWSQQGNTLFWVTNVEVVESLSIAEDGSAGRRRQIFKPEGGKCSGLAISNDGLTLAVSVWGYKGVHHSVVWLFGRDGENPRRLTKTQNLRETHASWCPTDDSLMAFVGSYIGPSWHSRQRLFLCSLDSGIPESVDLPPPYYASSGLYFSGGPPVSWSPDGRLIVVSALRADAESPFMAADRHDGGEPPYGAADILVLDVASSKWSKITDSVDSLDFYPRFRP